MSINRTLLSGALLKLPDHTALTRFLDNYNKVDAFGAGNELVDQTAMPEQVHSSVLVRANTMRENTWLRWTFLGDVTNAPPNAINYTIRIRWGGLTGPLMVSIPLTAPSSGVTNIPWRFIVEMQTGGPLGISCPIDTWLSAFWLIAGNFSLTRGTGTFDTTQNTYLTFSVQADSVVGAPHFRTLAGLLETF